VVHLLRNGFLGASRKEERLEPVAAQQVDSQNL
jgi:hypothetical protein